MNKSGFCSPSQEMRDISNGFCHGFIHPSEPIPYPGAYEFGVCHAEEQLPVIPVGYSETLSEADENKQGFYYPSQEMRDISNSFCCGFTHSSEPVPAMEFAADEQLPGVTR